MAGAAERASGYNWGRAVEGIMGEAVREKEGGAWEGCRDGRKYRVASLSDRG